MQRGLGTQLRLLIELLDGAVAEEYCRESLNYRPRYTPVMRALMARSPLSVTEIAKTAGITQPAATQTIALMIREGLLVSEASLEDSRQKVIKLTRYGCDLLPRLQACWEAVTHFLCRNF
jgi:DNA-binding MarR family transcriptional regulator